MDEKTVEWTNEKCEECEGWILHDLRHDVKYCEDCGLVISAPYMHEFEGVDYE